MVRGLLLFGIILMVIILMGYFSFTGLTMVVYQKYHIKF